MMMKHFIFSFLGIVTLGSSVQASSDDAWQAFRVEVATACLALPDAPKGAAVEVSPFGSESYGAALITWVEAGVVQRQMCIFRKSDHKAELAAPFQVAPSQPEP